MLSKDGINLIALGAKPNKLVLDKDKQKRLMHALGSCDYLKIEPTNHLLFACQYYEDRQICLQEQFNDNDGNTHFDDIFKIKISEITLRELLLVQSIYNCKTQSDIELLVEDQPFPHTLPTNSTPYFNNASNSSGAGYDGPGECLSHVLNGGARLYPAPVSGVDLSWWLRINASEFVPDLGVGMRPTAWLFAPPQCRQTPSGAAGDGGASCDLLVLPGGCDAILDENCPGCTDDGLELGSDGDFARYGAAHGIAILKPCQGGPIDAARFPHNHENLRGMVDVYGQLSADYATQTGHQMAPIGAMIRRLVGEKQVEA